MPRLAHLLLLVCFIIDVPARADEAAAPVDTPENIEFFEREIRPLLLAKCVACHGPEKQESSLRVDSREALLQGGELGVDVEPFHAERSLLIEAVRQDGDIVMPPNGKLEDREIAALEHWINLGAPWPQDAGLKPRPQDAARRHWSFRPVQRAALPLNKNQSWAETPVDRFVLAKLEQAALVPSPRADRRTLIRRVTFDLLGRPPTAEEVRDFELDQAADAYAQLVDRLLSSPQYGERWARHWLDVARYADTKGYVFFEDPKYPWAFTYRDYVIRALNEDLPYDQFILEQLAADQLEPARDGESLAALGFLTLGGHFMNNTHDIVDDRIDVTTRGLLGLTVTCARCHDHKYDPIEQTDYYALYGTFRSCYEPLVPPVVGRPSDEEKYQAFVTELDARQRKLLDFVTGKHKELTHGARTRAAEYLLAVHQLRDQPPTDNFMLITDTGELNPAMILRWQSYLGERDELPAAIWQPWLRLSTLEEAEFSARAEAVLKELESDPQTAVNPLIMEALYARPLNTIDDVANAYGDVLKSIEAKWQTAIQNADANARPPNGLENPDEEQLRQVLYGPRSPADAPMLLDWGFLSLFPDRATQDEYKKLLKEVETWLVSDGAPARAHVLLDSTVAHEPHVFLRGNPNRLGPRVPRRFLSALGGDERPFEKGSGRLELAQAIASTDNPLTARVMVNRIWMQHFGNALVRTPGDFGLRGEEPTHPELLDWLAYEFMHGQGDAPGARAANAWSIKRVHRLIVLSATYQQSSNDRSVCLEKDPENRLLWKQNRRRLEFEPLRDAMLFVAGSMNTTMGGPPVQIVGDAFETRRSIYGLIDRMDLPALLSTFDFPNPAASSPQRSHTTVPPQSLFFMNHPFVAEAAKRLVDREEVSAQTDVNGRIDAIYNIVFSRLPHDDERAAAMQYLGEAPDKGQWARYVHGLFMTNEFTFVD